VIIKFNILWVLTKEKELLYKYKQRKEHYILETSVKESVKAVIDFFCEFV
jgi:hypothetical protein